MFKYELTYYKVVEDPLQGGNIQLPTFKKTFSTLEEALSAHAQLPVSWVGSISHEDEEVPL